MAGFTSSLLLACILSCSMLRAQRQACDSPDSALNHALQLYHNTSSDQSGIFNGSLYLRAPYKFDRGHPYFYADAITNGNVIYENVRYSNIPLLYDEAVDELITTDITGLNLVRLVKEKVQSFCLYGQNFIYYPPAKVPGMIERNSPPPGYYRVLYNGRMQVLQKETKILQEKIVRENEYNRFVETRNNYWLTSTTGVYSTDKFRSLMAVFGNFKKPVQEHLKRAGLKYNRERANTIIEAVKFYETLVVR